MVRTYDGDLPAVLCTLPIDMDSSVAPRSLQAPGIIIPQQGHGLMKNRSGAACSTAAIGPSTSELRQLGRVPGPSACRALTMERSPCCSVPEHFVGNFEVELQVSRPAPSTGFVGNPVTRQGLRQLRPGKHDSEGHFRETRCRARAVADQLHGPVERKEAAACS